MAAALGDIIYRGSSVWKRMPGNTTTTRKFLRQTGTGSASAPPVWDTVGLEPATVTLTNAEIIALPTTPITLVANAGPGAVVNWIHADLFAKFAAGAYGNVDPDAAFLSIGASGGAQASTNIANDTSGAPDYTLSALTKFFDGTNKRARMLPYLQTPVIAVGGGSPPGPVNVTDSGWVLTSTEDGTFGMDAFTDLDDTSIALVFDNAAAGNLTGGHASNVLKAVVYYSVETLP
jgi:hypothetical protein